MFFSQIHIFCATILFSIISLWFTVSCSPLTSSSFYHPTNAYSSSSPRHVHYGNRMTVGSIPSVQFTQLFDNLACRDFEDHYWNHIHHIMLNYEHLQENEILSQLRQVMDNSLENFGQHLESKRQLQESFLKLYKETLSFFRNKSPYEMLNAIARIELSEHTQSIEITNFIQKIRPLLMQINRQVTSMSFTCKVTSSSMIIVNGTSMSIPFLNQLRDRLHPLVYGARKVMSIAYQSCNALDLPLMSSTSPRLKGVQKISNSDYQTVRSISSLSEVHNSHYYLREKRDGLKPRQCANTTLMPLVYDFGGKPSVQNYPHPSMNFFENAGAPSPALGLDCSGFVFSSMAGAGLRMKQGRPMTAAYISGVNSSMFHEERVATCFKPIQSILGADLQGGDVISTNSHIAIVDEVYEDPLGIQSISSVSECDKITQNHLNFSVIHSSDYFGGIGIHRIHIQDIRSPDIIRGLLKKASQLCYKKWSMSPRSEDLSLVEISRHMLTPDCREREMYIRGQECLNHCSTAELAGL